MFAFAPLIAFDLWEALPIVVVVVLWILGAVNQFITKNREAAAKQRAGQNQAGAPPQGADAQRNEVEEFLRDVVKRRGKDGPPRKVKPREMEVELLEPEPEETRRLVQARPTEASIRLKKRLADEVRGKSRKPPKPQSNVELADERMVKHMQEVFDHNLGTLTADSITEAEDVTQGASAFRQKIATSSITAAGLGAMLRDQQSLKEAIVLMEILKRPEERW